ncbi:hypothetical protein EVAR_94842_1 [Eumeta japonica]|uniref:Uncharacterized protein n=1 Tax=Eumeta variegata TaxID=151549 RepID=A0A4C1UIM2_EUMVA|nr:hypothetical protein EVAR_94842_1 [Eumeta japonica]
MAVSISFSDLQRSSRVSLTLYNFGCIKKSHFYLKRNCENIFYNSLRPISRSAGGDDARRVGTRGCAIESRDRGYKIRQKTVVVKIGAHQGPLAADRSRIMRRRPS